MEWSTYADVWALAVTFYELLSGKILFDGNTTLDVELGDACPSGFPIATFGAVKSIIAGGGTDVSPDHYTELFCLDKQSSNTNQIPDELVEKYNLTSVRQKTLVLALLNMPKLDQPRSKKVVINSYYTSRGFPISGSERDKFLAVYSQLKKKKIVRYTKPVKGKVVLTNEFIADFERCSQ